MTKVAPVHGGNLAAASARYGHTTCAWMDLSTGISPWSWPIPPLPQQVWQALPPLDPISTKVQRAYYGVAGLATPGSQWSISHLPACLPLRRVWIPVPGYEEHHYRWQRAGHEVRTYTALPCVSDLRPQDVVVVINPTNPSTYYYQPARLLELALALKSLKGYLVVDEAFMDPTPSWSLLSRARPDNVMVLRSVGKFFGLAGVRLGFLFGPDWLLAALRERLDPWAITHPTSYVAARALADNAWQQRQRHRLLCVALRLQALLKGALPTSQWQVSPLFCSASMSAALAQPLLDHCGEQALLLRYFPQWHLVRVGLPHPSQWQRLAQTLYEYPMAQPE